MRATIPLVLTVAGLTACTTIERVNVNTVAVNCDITRGDEKAGNGSGDASVLSQAGSAAAAFAGSLYSVIECPDGTLVEAAVDGGDVAGGESH